MLVPREYVYLLIPCRFRWVVCQLETLRRSAQRNVRGILEKLPKTLDETYERVLNEINDDNRGHARRLLHCIAVAVYPLNVGELAEILAVDFDGAQGGVPEYHPDWRWKDQEEAVLSICSSLIAVVDHYSSRVVQFSHFSVKEFLTSDRLASSIGDVSRYHILPGPAHTILAHACLGFLLHLDDDVDERVKHSPFAFYAARHWADHAQFEDVASHLMDAILSLFDPDRPYFEAWRGIWDNDISSGPAGPNPLYYSVLCGVRGLVEHFVINHPELVNTICGSFDFPLLAALYDDNLQVAEFLLRHGADVNGRGRNGRTPLHIAVLFEGYNAGEAVRFLLEHAAHVNSRTHDLCTPLHDAVYRGQEEVAQILLEHGANIDSRNAQVQTPLHVLLDVVAEFWSEEGENTDFVRLLLENGANVNAQDGLCVTPLHSAVRWFLPDTTRMLLEHGAKPNAKNRNGKTPLHLLLGHNLKVDVLVDVLDSLALVQTLVEHGADVNAQGDDHKTPLLLAVEEDMCEMTRALLIYGAEPNVKNDRGMTLLHRSLLGDFVPANDVPGLVQLFLESGADVNAQDYDHKTPLLLAIELGMADVAQILLEHGAEPNAVNDNGQTPLHLLLEEEYYYDDDGTINEFLVVGQLLLECGADVNAEDNKNVTPLHLASNHRRHEIAQIILGCSGGEKDASGRLAPVHTLSEGKYDF